jgi:hypothetical protein
VIPRVTGRSADEVAARMEEFRASGAEGFVLSFGTEPAHAVAAMREFAQRYR